MNAEEEQSQAAAQFENACLDRIKQFDDSDSDEEVSVESVGCGVWRVWGMGCGVWGVGCGDCGVWRVGCGVWGMGWNRWRIEDSGREGVG